MSGLASVQRALPECRFGRHIHYASTVDSTNQWAREQGQEGEPDGAVFVADAQTAGRGRWQRRWVSPPGAGLYTSVLLRPEFPAAESGPAVQLAAGIAVAESIAEKLPQPPTLRWPNDCYIGNRKIAGVLVEAESSGRSIDFLVCGIGINVNHGADDFPEELRDTATSLRMQLGHEISRLSVLTRLLRAFDEWEDAWRTHGLEPIRERWLELSPESRGGEVVVETEAGRLGGTADGLTVDGHLRVRTAAGVEEVAVGEVVRLRPA